MEPGEYSTMTVSSKQGSPFGDMTYVIAACRRRLLGRMLLDAMFRAMLLATATYLVINLLQYVAPVLPWGLVASSGNILRVSIGVMVVALTCLSFKIVLRIPDKLSVARYIEWHCDLDERLSTLLELEANQKKSRTAWSALTTLLQRDVASYATHIHPHKIAPIMFPRWVITFQVAFLLASVGFQFVPPLPGSVAMVPVEVSSLMHEELLEMATMVRRASGLIAGDAEQRQDAYLRAIAQALEQLSDDIKHGRIDSTAATRQLSRLVEHLNRAYDSEQTGAGLYGEPDDFTSLPSQTNEMRQETAKANNNEESDGVAREQVFQMEASDHEMVEGALKSDPRSTLMDLIAHLTPDIQDSEPATQVRRTAQRSTQADSDQDRPYSDTFEASDIQAADSQRDRDNPFAAQLGMADITEVGEGMGEEAGVHSSDLFGRMEADLVQHWANEVAMDFELPVDPLADRRIRFEASPEMDLTIMAVTEIEHYNWMRKNHETQPRDIVATSYREVVSRYFLSPLERADSE